MLSLLNVLNVFVYKFTEIQIYCETEKLCYKNYFKVNNFAKDFKLRWKTGAGF